MLLEGSGAHEDTIRAKLANAGKKAADVRWLIAHHRFGDAVVLIDTATGEPIDYIAVDTIWTQRAAP